MKRNMSFLQFTKELLFSNAKYFDVNGFKYKSQVTLNIQNKHLPEYGKTGTIIDMDYICGGICVFRVDFGEDHPFGGYWFRENRLEKVS